MASYESSLRKASLEAARLHRDLSIQAQTVHGSGRVDVYGTIARLRVPLMFTRLDGLLGAYYREPAPGILVTTQRPSSQQRYTAAHELGHHHLGHSPSLDDENILRRSQRRPSSPAELQEAEAEAFAAAFLLPRWLLDWHCERQNWTDSDLADPINAYQLALRVGISYEAAVWTMHQYGVFDRGAARELADIKLKSVKQHLLKGYEPANFRETDVWLVVKLTEHSGSGYLWRVDAIDGEALAVVADGREPIGVHEIGGPSKRLITTAAQDRRTGELRLAEARPWQPGAPLNTFAVQYDLSGAERQGWYRDQRKQHRLDLEAKAA
jgi:Zn-dependent peptidase ImmA (M78 family)